MSLLPQELRLLLSSTVDAEALSAVSTVERLLKRHDLEWSDLANHTCAARPAATPQQPTWGASGREMPAAQLNEMVVAIREYGRLSERARGFLIDLETRTQLYARVSPSPKQNERSRRVRRGADRESS